MPTSEANKIYFPSELWKKRHRELFYTDAFEVWDDIAAVSRTDAARKVWKENEYRLLQLMGSRQTTLPRKVSLHVNDPKAQTSGIASRLIPILVYVGE